MPEKMSHIERKRGLYFRPWSPNRNEEVPLSKKTVDEDQCSVTSSMTYHSSTSILSRPGSSLDSSNFTDRSNEGITTYSTDSAIERLQKQFRTQSFPVYQSPVYSPDNWQSGLNLQPLNFPLNNFMFHGHFPSSRLHCRSIEESIFMLQQQEALAKQLKKLRPKKFKCPECGVAFSNNGQLSGHVRIHTGERPFKCDFESCGKSFTRNEELTRHRRIHTGAKPHKCVECSKKFGRKDHLKKHMRTHDQRRYYYPSDTFELLPIYHPDRTIRPIPPYFYPV